MSDALMTGHRVAGSHTGPPVLLVELLLVEPLLVEPLLVEPLLVEEEVELDIVPLLDDCAPPVPPVPPASGRSVTSWRPITSEQPPEAVSMAAARSGHFCDGCIRGLP
jgi:hypothetical protein